MSCILAIELSTPRGHMAVLREGSLIYERDFTSQRSHNSMLYAPLTEALEVAGSALSKIVVGTGPGSYTGVRISIAAAYGVALSRGAPVVGLPSIASLSEAAEHLVIGDARRGKFYVAHVRAGTLIAPVALHDETSLLRLLDEHAGVPCFTSDAKAPLGLERVRLGQPNAVLLAKLGMSVAPDDRDIEPLYVQEAFITKAKTPTMGGVG